jgi:periplasmic protein TonB
MAYADQNQSSRRTVGLVLVILLHAALGYAFITGLAFNVVKKVAEDLKTFDVEEEPPPPPDEPPPPPPTPQEVQPPPVVTPPPIVQTQSVQAPVIIDVPRPPPPTVTAPVAPPPPPAPPRISQAAGAKGDPAQWITNDDYPPSAQRDGREGVSGIAWDINAQGRVENCRVTSSSGSPDLDDTACRLIVRRGRYTPAKDEAGNPMRSTASRRVRWVLPKD